MYYCFIESDINCLNSDDPLMLQVRYAKRLGLYCCCSLPDGMVVDGEGNTFCVANQRIFLRATCETIRPAAIHLADLGAVLLETIDDIDTIEHWEQLNLHSRTIIDISLTDILNCNFSAQAKEFLKSNKFVFIKSRRKGFTVQTRTEKLLNGDEDLLNFFKQQSYAASSGLMLSKHLSVKRDSLGNKESRYFVRDGVIFNSSRTVHSIRHTVPRSQQKKANDFVTAISKIKCFPQNYVIDVGEFEEAGRVFADIIEINPITSSLCYVNNSIFDAVIPEIIDMRSRMNFGAEYCYDAIEHPERYIHRRPSNVCFEYSNTEHYSFL